MCYTFSPMFCVFLGGAALYLQNTGYHMATFNWIINIHNKVVASENYRDIYLFDSLYQHWCLLHHTQRICAQHPRR